MAKREREQGQIFYWKVPVTIRVIGPLYASSPTTTGGIDAALYRNMPSESQVRFRESLGEEITPIEDLAREIAESIPQIEPVPSTVFRRDKEGRPCLHANYLKGHVRDCGETTSRLLNFWGLKDFLTRTVNIRPAMLVLDGEIKAITTPISVKVRRSSGVEVIQSTLKIEEFIESPELRWWLYLLGDPRWDRSLLEQLLICGSSRGIGPGRAKCASEYEFELGEFEKVPRVPRD